MNDTLRRIFEELKSMIVELEGLQDPNNHSTGLQEVINAIEDAVVGIMKIALFTREDEE